MSMRQPPRAQRSSAGSSSPHRHTVLLVDDSDDVREALETFLRQQSCEVVSAADAPTALAMLGDGLRPCLTLVDVRLPGMDGWQLVKRHCRQAR